jgi:hypothetical protein
MKLFRSASRLSGLAALFGRPTTLRKGGVSKCGPSVIPKTYRLRVWWSITEGFSYHFQPESARSLEALRELFVVAEN